MSKQSTLQLKSANIQPAPTQPDRFKETAKEAAKRAAVAAEAAAQSDKASSTKKGAPVTFIGRAWKALTSKPDHSEVGFHNAIRDAIKLAEEIDYVSADHMCEEIEYEISKALSAPGGVYVEFIGTHKKDRGPRLLIVTNWGLRVAIKGMISFSMVHAPERRRER